MYPSLSSAPGIAFGLDFPQDHHRISDPFRQKAVNGGFIQMRVGPHTPEAPLERGVRQIILSSLSAFAGRHSYETPLFRSLIEANSLDTCRSPGRHTPEAPPTQAPIFELFAPFFARKWQSGAIKSPATWFCRTLRRAASCVCLPGVFPIRELCRG